MEPSTLAVLLVFVLQQGPHSAQEDFVARLRTWESRFRSVAVQYRSDDLDRTKMLLCTLPAHESLCKNGKTVESYENGVFYHFLPRMGPRMIGIAYGSYVSKMLSTMVGDMRSLLYFSGVLLTKETPMSVALERGKVSSASHRADGGGVIEFDPPKSIGVSETVRIEWSDSSDIPSAVTLIRKDFMLRRALVRVAHKSFPLRIEQTLTEPGKEVRRYTLAVVDAPVPVSSNIKILKPNPGDVVYDEDFGIRYTQGERSGLDREKVAVVIDKAKSGQALAGSPSRPLLCGADCLYYMARIGGLAITDSAISDQLPEARRRGSNFSELLAAARSIGIPLIGYRLSYEQLLRLNRPAILMMRGAHFSLFTGALGGNAIVIDPPYSVRVIDHKASDVLWTGEALVEQR